MTKRAVKGKRKERNCFDKDWLTIKLPGNWKESGICVILSLRILLLVVFGPVTFFPLLTRELRIRNTSYRELREMCRTMGYKHYANEVRSRLTFKLLPIFD